MKRNRHDNNIYRIFSVINDGNERVSTLPYEFKSTVNGLYMNLPEKVAEDTYVYTTFQNHWLFSSLEGFSSRQVVDFDELSVTVQWSSSEGSMKAPLVRGMAYGTAFYEDQTPILVTENNIETVDGAPLLDGQLEISGMKVTIGLDNGQTWIVYFSEQVTLQASVNDLTVRGKFTGSVRITNCPDESVEMILDQHSQKIPTGKNH